MVLVLMVVVVVVGMVGYTMHCIHITFNIHLPLCICFHTVVTHAHNNNNNNNNNNTLYSGVGLVGPCSVTGYHSILYNNID